jgi:hypothetical protein
MLSLRIDQRIILQVCSEFGAYEVGIMDELSRLKHKANIPIKVVLEECFDTGASQRSFAVGTVSIAPATPEQLHKAVEMVW